MPPQTYRVDVDRLMAASSLGARIEARARLARAELAALNERLAALSAEEQGALGDRASLQALVDARSHMTDRLLREALRVIAGGAAPARANDEQQLVFEETTALETSLDGRLAQLSADGEALLATQEAVAAKEDELRRLDQRAQWLLDVRASSEVAVLSDMADEASRVADAINELLGAAEGNDHAAIAWSWPLRGAISQSFGPSPLSLEPAAIYRGILFPHFHAAIDLAAPLGTPVRAPAPGRVTFVGHLPDGAMVVVIAHDDGYASLYAHLDDAFAPPPVRPGTRVAQGDVVGYVGMTGMTTGPHLHFAVELGGEPVDPLALLPGN